MWSYLVSQSLCVGVAAVVVEGHGGEDGAAHRDDVELGHVVVLQDALRHLQAVRGGDLHLGTGDVTLLNFPLSLANSKSFYFHNVH